MGSSVDIDVPEDCQGWIYSKGDHCWLSVSDQAKDMLSALGFALAEESYCCTESEVLCKTGGLLVLFGGLAMEDHGEVSDCWEVAREMAEHLGSCL